MSKKMFNDKNKSLVEKEWSNLTKQFELAQSNIPTRSWMDFLLMKEKYMSRKELSFHDHVKLLGYLCIDVHSIPGDILEIGVWKGKSLALMDRLSSNETKIIGVDPCELPGQLPELKYYQEQLFQSAEIITDYSEKAISAVSDISQKFKIIHIDGGHSYHNVWMDFLLYERFLVPGGYIVFDDYNDLEFSPEVNPAVNDLQRKGFFERYKIIGAETEFNNSFLIQLSKNRANDDL